MAPLRVLNVHAGNIFGGVETIMLAVVRHGGVCPGMRWDFALCFEDRLAKELREAGAVVHPLAGARLSRPWTVWRARRDLRRLLGEGGHDVVACHSAWGQAVFGPSIRALGRPSLLWLHNRTEGRGWVERASRWSGPSFVLAVSRDAQATLPRLYPGVASEVIHAPLPPNSRVTDPSVRGEVRGAMGVKGDEVVIVQVSRMEAWKGHDLHLRALAGVADRPNWTCWFVGKAQRPEEIGYVRGLEDLARQLGLEGRVKFLGGRSDVPRLLAAADVFCQPNRESEGFSLAFMEACAAGLPVVTSALGGALELVSEENGFPTAVGDVAGVTAALRTLIDDPEVRRRKGEAGRRRVEEQCDPGRQLGRYRDLFARLAGREG